MGRFITFVYGAVCHAGFLAVFTYMVGFLGDFAVPKSVDSGPESPIGQALWVNASLIALFGLQHTLMARPGFKRWWTRFVPAPIERSTYVLISNAVMVLLFWQWRPMGEIVWHVENPAGQAVLYGLFGFGWLFVVFNSFLINHFDLFGTRQVWLHLRGKPYQPLPFKLPGTYKFIRHPLYVGWMMAFWATPTMTQGHFMFAAGMSLYILAAIPFEERDLVSAFGEKYLKYRIRVPMFIPRMLRGSLSEGSATASNARESLL